MFSTDETDFLIECVPNKALACKEDARIGCKQRITKTCGCKHIIYGN